MSKLYDLLSAMCGKIKKPDWNQNDSAAPDYVKNRPFYTYYPSETVLTEERTESFSDPGYGIYMAQLQVAFEIKVGEIYKVYWDGAAYECPCAILNETLFIGNLSIGGGGSDTGEPFIIGQVASNFIIVYAKDTSDSHTFSISVLIPEVVKIDEKYLPDTIATKPEVETAQTAADNAQTAADKNKEMLSKMVTSIATFTFDKQTSGRDTFVFNGFSYYKISDFNPAPEDVISFTGTRETGENFSIITDGNNCVGYGFFIVVASAGACEIPISTIDGNTVLISFTAPSAGLYARYKEGNQAMTAWTGQFTLRGSTGIWPINGLLLKSSTAGSTKEFRITVTDSGTLTATEVTE